MKRRIVIEVDDEIVDQKHRECGGVEELTGLCFLAAPKAWHDQLGQERLTHMLAEHGITLIRDEEIIE